VQYGCRNRRLGYSSFTSPTKARAAAEQALRLDDSVAEAHTSLAGLLHRNDGDLAAAEREFTRALELNSDYATAHQWYSIFLAEEGRSDEALHHAREAVALDPLSGPMRQTLTLVHYLGRRFDLAVSDGRRALEFAPHLSLARDFVGRSLLALRRPREAIQVSQGSATPTPEMLATMSLAHLRLGERARAEALFSELAGLKPQPTGAMVRWYTATGDYDKALDALGQAVAARAAALQPLKSDPALDPLRAMPRFQEILRRGKLP
jgi:tetratricopeptide (TPR) repeat protein